MLEWVLNTSGNTLKEMRNLFKKVTFEPLMDLKQNHYGSWKYYKSCYF